MRKFLKWFFIFFVIYAMGMVLNFGTNEPQKNEKLERKDSYFERGDPYKVFVSQLNVREKPTVKSKAIYKLSCGDVVYGVKGSEKKNDNWVKIILPDSNNSRTGWVSDEYLIELSDIKLLETAMSLRLGVGITGVSYPVTKFVKVYINSYSDEGYSLHKLNVTVKNNSCFYLEDPVLYIKERGESGTEIFSYTHTEYVIIPPYSKRTFEITFFGHPQAKMVTALAINGKFLEKTKK